LPSEEIRDLDYDPSGFHSRGLPRKPHALRDVEFYTRLPDEVARFKRNVRSYPRDEWWGRFNAWVGLEGGRPTEFFDKLKRKEPAKWRKAIKEFLKAVEKDLGQLRRGDPRLASHEGWVKLASVVPKPHSPKVWDRIWESEEEWRQEWEDRVREGEDSPSWKTIIRGVPLYDDFTLEEGDRIMAGKAMPKDLLNHLKTAGIYWYILGQGGSRQAPTATSDEDSKLYAFKTGDHIGSNYVNRMRERVVQGRDKMWGFELPLLLVAERPVDWHPYDNESRGLMGESYIDPRVWKSVKLKEIHYYTGSRWVKVPVSKQMRLE